MYQQNGCFQERLKATEKFASNDSFIEEKFQRINFAVSIKPAQKCWGKNMRPTIFGPGKNFMPHIV